MWQHSEVRRPAHPASLESEGGETMEDKLVEIITKLQEQLAAFAPQAWKYALLVTRINGLANLIAGVAFLILTLRLLRWHKKIREAEDMYDAEFPIVMGGIGVGISGLITGLLLLDPWNYVA